MKTPSLAVIGTGHWGRNLLRNYAALGALAGFCEIRADVRADFAAEYPHALAFADPEDVFSDDRIDAVAIATPAVSHGMLVAKALEAGKHVFVEKPLCLDVGEAALLGADADRRGLTLMVGHLLLYHA